MPNSAFIALALASAVCVQAAGSARGSAASKRPAPKPSREAPAPAAPALPMVDSAKVHTLYVEGEFDEAISLLEANLRETRQYSHDDSVFIYKHLGVMYAAQEVTREKGRYYMHRLLMVEPTAKIMDMYASDMIYMIFKNIQEEYQASHTRPSRPDTTRNVARTEPRPKDPVAIRDDSKKGGSGYLWMGAAAAAVVAGAATWYYVSGEKTKIVVVDHQPE